MSRKDGERGRGRERERERERERGREREREGEREMSLYMDRPDLKDDISAYIRHCVIGLVTGESLERSTYTNPI